MKKFRLLWKVIKRLNFDTILYGFIGWCFAAAFLILIAEPGITRFRDALWYIFVSSTSIGFGDIVPITFVGRTLTIITTFYALAIAAMFSGVGVSDYLEVIHRRERKEALIIFDKMAHLTDLSQEELQEIEEKIRQVKKNLG